MGTFGERIGFLLDKFGRKTLSESSGISTAQLHRLRNGEQDTTRERLVKIADACECSIEWLAAGRGSPFPKNSSDDLRPALSVVAEPSVDYVPHGEPLSSDELELLQLFRAAGLATKSRVLNELIK